MSGRANRRYIYSNPNRTENENVSVGTVKSARLVRSSHNHLSSRNNSLILVQLNALGHPSAVQLLDPQGGPCSSSVSSLRLDGLVWLTRVNLPLVDILVVALELVFASEADLVVIAAKLRTSEVLRIDAVLGRVMALQVAHAFGDEFAVSLTAFVISWLAVMGRGFFMIQELLEFATQPECR